MCLTEYDEEEFKRVCREDGYAEGRTDGLAEGRSEKAVEAAKNFYQNGVSIEIIANSLKMTVDEVNEIVKKKVLA